MVRKSILIVGIVLAICGGLVGGYVLWGRGEYVFPPWPSINGEDPPRASRQVTVLAADSFILSTGLEEHWSEQEYEEYIAWEDETVDAEVFLCSLRLPFNNFGCYLNRFYLQENEVVEVIVRSNEPLAINELEGLRPTISCGGVSLIGIGAGVTGDVENPFSPTLQRVNSNWELRFTLKAEDSGYCFLAICNHTPDQIWCQYAMILKS